MTFEYNVSTWRLAWLLEVVDVLNFTFPELDFRFKVYPDSVFLRAM